MALPGTTARRPSALALLAILAVLALAGGRPALAGELPDLGDATSGTLSLEAERRLGHAWLRMLRSQANLYYDPLVNDYVEHLVFRIAAGSDLADARLSIVMINSADINAFAVPGGIMGLNAGLLLKAQGPDEVAAVVAHEVAHLSQRHYARRLARDRQNQPLALSAVLASILVAATVGGDAGAAAILGTQAALIQNSLAFSREHEAEADRVGMQTLVRAQFDPGAMPRFFERLQRDAPLDPDLYPEFLRTHPITENRIADSRNRAGQLPAQRPAARDQLDFDLARARLQVAFARDGASAVNILAGLLDGQDDRGPLPLRYGLALAHLRNNQPDEALRILRELRREDPVRIALVVAEGEALLAAGRAGEAAGLLGAALRVSPGNFPLTMEAANALLRNKQAPDAVRLLDTLATGRRDDPQVWSLLAQARAAAGDTVGMNAAHAEYLFLGGNLDAALEQLRQGIAQAGNNYARAAPLRARHQEMEQTRNDFNP
jgi:predicted Zn-dependent protease